MLNRKQRMPTKQHAAVLASESTKTKNPREVEDALQHFAGSFNTVALIVKWGTFSTNYTNYF